VSGMDAESLREFMGQGLTREGFLADDPAPALVVDPLGVARGGGSETPRSSLPKNTPLEVHGTEVGGGTEVLGPLQSAQQLARMASALIDPNSAIYWLRKSDRNPFGSLITVGRAPNNDVVINHTTVSKVHVIFTHPTDQIWFIADDTSANGTFLNGARLTPKEKIAISDGDRVRLGPDVVARFFLPSSLWDYAQLASGAGL